MEKELSDMTIVELWELFPIFLVEPNNQWDEYYGEDEAGVKYEFQKEAYGFTVVFYRHSGEGWGWSGNQEDTVKDNDPHDDPRGNIIQSVTRKYSYSSVRFHRCVSLCIYN